MDNSITIGLVVVVVWCGESGCFWDEGTTTVLPGTEPTEYPRQSFFRWPKLKTPSRNVFYRFFMSKKSTNTEEEQRKRLCGAVVGISFEFIPITTGTILNSRTVITAANALEPYVTRMRELRVWALGRAGGSFNTPYRYRVWRWRRMVPRSLNPEHQHGAFGRHSPRHDLAVLHTMDIMYLSPFYPRGLQYAFKMDLCNKDDIFDNNALLIMVGSGFISFEHVMENYYINQIKLTTDLIVNCERYLPKWWGKFICMKNVRGLAGVQNGGPLLHGMKVMAVGCFEIRYNSERVLVFTDLRYYIELLKVYTNYTKGEYYEYAYSQWGNRVKSNWLDKFSKKNKPFIPAKYYGSLGPNEETSYY